LRPYEFFFAKIRMLADASNNLFSRGQALLPGGFDVTDLFGNPTIRDGTSHAAAPLD
jgi:hypothetical protein